MHSITIALDTYIRMYTAAQYLATPKSTANTTYPPLQCGLASVSCVDVHCLHWIGLLGLQQHWGDGVLVWVFVFLQSLGVQMSTIAHLECVASQDLGDLLQTLQAEMSPESQSHALGPARQGRTLGVGEPTMHRQ